VSELLDVFGPERCMLGSNFPVEMLSGSFASLDDLMLAVLCDLSDRERADVLGGTARRPYRLATDDGSV
jgi:L-fuconolactonase